MIIATPPTEADTRAIPSGYSASTPAKSILVMVAAAKPSADEKGKSLSNKVVAPVIAAPATIVAHVGATSR